MAENKKASRGSEFWQIIFPALIGLILVGLLCAWIVVAVSPGNISRFAEISAVLLVIPVLFFSLFSLLLLGLLIYLVQRMIQVIPPLTTRVVEFLEKIQEAVRKISEVIVKPVIQPTSVVTGIRNIFAKKGTRYRIE
jgi:Zn-dependent protease with chaperone function